MIPRAPRTPEQHEAGVLRKWARHDERMKWVERYGASYLYPLGYDELEIQTLRGEISKKLNLELPAADIGPVTQDEGAWNELLDRTAVCGSCGSDDLMEFEHLHWFACEACNKPTPVVMGCLNCTHIRCPECVPSRQRGAGSLMPMKIIAASFEVTRARIHEVLQGALRKLRHPSRAHLLKPFVDWRVPKHGPPHRASWTELALVEADSVEEATGTCVNCGRTPEALRPCVNCGGRICSNCSYDFGAPKCGRATWYHSSSLSCDRRQAERGPDGPR